MAVLVARPSSDGKTCTATLGLGSRSDTDTEGAAGVVAEVHLIKEGLRSNGEPNILLSSVSGSIPQSVVAHLEHMMDSSSSNSADTRSIRVAISKLASAKPNSMRE